MLPTLGLISATIGLLLIIFLIYREQKAECGPAERNMLLVVGLVTLVVGAFHILSAGSGGAH
jgi:formate hydrogenlyase subunit 3/multisubunit Na+/H+ antiporter MnhD subunit